MSLPIEKSSSDELAREVTRRRTFVDGGSEGQIIYRCSSAFPLPEETAVEIGYRNIAHAHDSSVVSYAACYR